MIVDYYSYKYYTNTITCSINDSFLFKFSFYLYWYSYYILIVCFVCDSASEFGAMGWLYFLFGVFLPEPVKKAIFRNQYHIFLASVGTFSGYFLFYFYFIFLYLILGYIACDHGNSFLCLEE